MSQEIANRAHFEVYWQDLRYTIEPKFDPSQVWRQTKRSFKSTTTHLKQRLVSPFSTSREYDCNSSQSNKSSSSHGNEPISIIQQINGSFKSGELTAVMGPSGAGKTSLLNFLSRRREDGYSGQLYVDDSQQQRIKISTIPQHDSMPGYLTVRENLMFASRLKNTQRHYDQEKNIARVSNLLGLDDCLDTMTKKISGGQQKRLAIAQELLSKPEILVLDEPTSGLDSVTCYKTISVLKNLVRDSARRLIDPIAIVLTIHQPDEDVFELFDKVYVMANGGIAIYNGPPQGCAEYVERHSGVKMIDDDYNPASFLIEIASGEHGHEPIKKLEAQVIADFKPSMVKNKSLAGSYSSLNQRQVGYNISQMDLLEVPKKGLKSCSSIDSRLVKASSMNREDSWSKTWALTERSWLSMIRDPVQMLGRILFIVLLPVSFALIFGREPGSANACPKFKPEYHISEFITGDEDAPDEPHDQMLLTLENMSVLFILNFAMASINMALTTLNFTIDIQRSLKEYHNGWYSMPSYIVARILSDLPLLILMPMLTFWLNYILTGQAVGAMGMTQTWRALITASATILGLLVCQSMSMIIGSLNIGHLSTALFLSQAGILPMVFISGFITRTKNMPTPVYLLSYLSIFRHMSEATLTTRYGFGICPCDESQLNGGVVKMVGISDRLKSFTKYYMDSQSSIGDTPNNDTDSDMFSLFAKQVSLYNTYGIEVKSCSDVRPYHMKDLSLHESKLIYSFFYLFVLVVIAKVTAFLTVKLVVKYKTSL